MFCFVKHHGGKEEKIYAYPLKNFLSVLSVKLKVTTAVPLFSECSRKNSFQ